MKEISNQIIAEIVRRIIDSVRPIKIILFGSFARGNQTEESDIDILVIEDEIRYRRKEMVKIRRALRDMRIPVDIIVASKRQIEEYGLIYGTVLFHAMQEGKTLYVR
ncbi:nucleotidyltransferase domain-containing protein [bacterium]|nr:nucleotidyltransferase domain-containing protein [bacterium]MBU1752270.1 nucleotidyltransferase domain-containing protein [bacterium]